MSSSPHPLTAGRPGTAWQGIPPATLSAVRAALAARAFLTGVTRDPQATPGVDGTPCVRRQYSPLRQPQKGEVPWEP